VYVWFVCVCVCVCVYSLHCYSVEISTYREELIYSTDLLIVNFCILSVKTAPEKT